MINLKRITSKEYLMVAMLMAATLVFVSMMSTTVQAKQADAVIVGLAPDYPPMEFIDSTGEIVGYDLDVMKVVFERLGQHYVLKSMKWSEKDELLEKGDIDLIWSGLSITDERKQQYELSTSYLSGDQVFVVTTNSDIDSISSLANTKLGVISEKFLRPYIENFQQELGANFASVKEYADLPTAIDALLANEAEVIIARSSSIRYHVRHSLDKFKILPQPLVQTEGTGVAAKKGNKDLMDKISETLETMKADGSLKTIEKRWFGE